MQQLHFIDKSIWGLQNQNKAVIDAYKPLWGHQNEFQIYSVAIMLVSVPQSGPQRVRHKATVQLSADSKPAGVPFSLRHPASTSNSPGQVFTMPAILVQDLL